jgi:hypothetical protein
METNKKGGIVVQITEGQYAGKMAIAMRRNQAQEWIKQNKICLTVYEDENFQNKIADNVIISVAKCKRIGFVD